MLIAQWISEITDILMYKIGSFRNISVTKKIARKLFAPPTKNVPTALLRGKENL